MGERRIAHLVRRGQVFYFRRALPDRLVGILGQREVKLSLETQDLGTAKLRCRVLSNLFEQLTSHAEAELGMTPEDIRELAQRYFVRHWAKNLELAFIGPSDPGFDPAHEVEWLTEHEKQLRLRLISRSFNGVILADADELVAEYGLKGSSISKEDLGQLHYAMLRARVEETRILSALLSGRPDDAYPKDPLFQGLEEPPLPPTPFDETEPVIWTTVSQLSDKFCTQKSDSEWVAKTYNENRRVLDWFCEYVGKSKPIKQVTLEDVREFRDTIMELPANFSKSKKFHGVAIKDIVALSSDEPKLAAKTKQKYFFNLKGFFKWCEDDGYITSNPAAKLSMNVKVNEKDARHPISLDHLSKLFSSPQYVGHLSHAKRHVPGEKLVRDGKYWVPLIGLFAGMRLGEIVQLLETDVRMQGDVPYFNIAKGEGEDDKQIKTEAGVRVVPIHPQLVRMGFLEFVEGRRKASPQGRIFEDVTRGADGYYSHNFSKYFSRYLTHIGAKTAKTSFHSLRHNFMDAMRAAHIEDSRLKALFGHADNSVTASYGSSYSASDLAQDIAAVGYGLDFQHLYPVQ